MSNPRNKAKYIHPSVFTTLPTELLVEIFRFGVVGVIDRRNHLFTLGAVCRRLREVAWGCEDLWKHLNLDISRLQVPTQLVLLHEWLRRSGKSPLHLTLDTEQGTVHAAVRTLTVLLLECNRWHSLTLQGRSARFLSKELAKGGYEFPQLAELVVGDYTYPLGVSPPLVLKKANLRSLTIKAEEWTCDHFDLDWDGIRSIDICGTYEDLCALLPRVAEHVQQACILPTTPPYPPFQVIRLPALHTLQIGSESVCFYGDLLDRSFVAVLNAPSLQHLIIVAYLYDNETPLADLLLLSTMIDRSECALVKLELYNVKTSTQDIIRLLDHIPTLEDLQLTTFETQLYDRFFKALTPSRKGIILPRLSRIIYAGGLSAQPSSIVNFVRSRVSIKVPATLSHSGALGLPSRKLETLMIHCKDGAWAKDKDPNAIFSFYRDMFSFSAQGLYFSMTYGCENNPIDIT